MIRAVPFFEGNIIYIMGRSGRTSSGGRGRSSGRSGRSSGSGFGWSFSSGGSGGSFHGGSNGGRNTDNSRNYNSSRRRHGHRRYRPYYYGDIVPVFYQLSGQAITIIVIFVVISALAFACSGFGYAIEPSEGTEAIPPSTVQRTPLEYEETITSEFYHDSDGSWIGNDNQLFTGMDEFYEETGVAPYLYILPNGLFNKNDPDVEMNTILQEEAQYNMSRTFPQEELTITSSGLPIGDRISEFSQKLYAILFEDGAHFLVVFCDDGNGGFDVGYWVGGKSRTIIDEEAIDIFSAYLNNNYLDYSLTEEQIFSNTFVQTADRIMSITQSPTVPILIIIAVISGICVVIFVVVTIIRNKREKDKKMEGRYKSLEKFGDQELEELEKKYESTD